jgi:hypothetical protein
MELRDIFQNKAQHLFWRRLPVAQIAEGHAHAEAPIENDKAYFVIRLKEMYLRSTRKLWRKFYPMLHGYVSYGKSEEHTVAGPGQLKELGDANLDRIVNLNYRLAGPIAYKGGDVSILTGLYSVPGQDATRALIDMISTVASLGGLAIGSYVQIANAVKIGVENVVGLNEARLELGIRDTFYQNNLFRSGYYVGIAAPETSIVFGQLWLRDGRLVAGADSTQALPYEGCDYFVLEIERRERREDWPGLPGITEFQDKFSAIMRDNSLTVTDKRKRLGALWPAFTETLNTSPFLVEPDRQNIALSVSQDLKARLDAMESGNPFETRAWGEKEALAQEPATFDLAGVPDYLEAHNAESVRRAQAALSGEPFVGG